MLLRFCILILKHLRPASTLLRGHLALATPSPPETDPQILERWGNADEVHMGKSVRAKDFGLECMRDVQRLFVNFTRRIGFRMSELFRKIDEDFGGSISWNTQPNCRVFDELYTTGPCARSEQTTDLPVLSYNSCFFNMATALLSPFF